MKMKPLSETNPFLKDPDLREEFIIRSVMTSCGVEGVNVDFSQPLPIEIQEKLSLYTKNSIK